MRYGGLLAVSGLVVLALAVWASPASSARPDCLVVDTNADQSYTALQDAVSAATAGDTLFVKGSCTGTTTIDRSLTIVGHSNGGSKTATLDGNHLGSVLTVGSGVEVTLTNLVVTGGVCGIVNNGGTVNLNGESAVRDNTCFGGGGILNAGTVNLNDASSVSGNNASIGGGIWNAAGTVNLNDNSSVNGNHADFRGGGIYNAGTVNLNDTSTISGNTAGTRGGGIFNFTGVSFTLNLNGGTVSGNTAGIEGNDIFTGSI